MHQLIDQPTRVDDKTSSVSDVILTSHPSFFRKMSPSAGAARRRLAEKLRPIQHFIVKVQFLNIHLVTTILFTLI